MHAARVLRGDAVAKCSHGKPSCYIPTHSECVIMTITIIWVIMTITII